MRPKTIAAATAAIAMGAVTAAWAQAPDAIGRPPNVCLWSYQIDHTHVVNPRTILFYMRDGKVWRNDLKGPCPGLNFHGFSFMSNSQEICSNAIGIKVIKTGEACSLGPFTRTAPRRPAEAP